MRSHHWNSGRIGRGIVAALLLVLSVMMIASVRERSAPSGMRAYPKLEATIFSYDGSDFVRTQTTLIDEKGKTAINTKLDHASPAYQALTQKRSFTGEATVFGKRYDANYAPLTDSTGRVTGALFVAVPK